MKVTLTALRAVDFRMRKTMIYLYNQDISGFKRVQKNDCVNVSTEAISGTLAKETG